MRRTRATDALYTSLSVLTALREASQAGRLQPTTLVCYEADIGSVADCRDEVLVATHDFDAHRLAGTTWRDEMRSTGLAGTHAFARRLMEAGYDAMLVRSFAPGTSAGDLNLVLWRWGASETRRLSLIDDEGRLSG